MHPLLLRFVAGFGGRAGPFAQRIPHYIIWPVAAVIGTVGYFVEREFGPRPAKLEYLERSVQDARAERLAEGRSASSDEAIEIQRRRTLLLNAPSL